MENENNTTWMSALTGEALLFGLLGRALYAEPDQEWLEMLIREEVFMEAPFGADQEEIQLGLGLLQGWAGHNTAGIPEGVFKALKFDHLRLFIGIDRVLAPAWESIYFSEKRLVFQEQTLQVRNWYARFGLQIERFNKEPDDHIGLELSFISHLASLAVKALQEENTPEFETILQAQRDFLCEHLLRWAPAWVALVNQHAETDYYRGLAHLTHGALLGAAQMLEIQLPKEVSL